MISSDIRKSFLKFFENNGHKIVESSSVIPQNDPSLLFTNAGMVQFKNVFTELESTEYTRAVSSQKCIRAGGKHNDLDQVGFTARHHTFFEMLGNFSFGDYFKEDAINFSWTFLTKELQLPKEKLLVTVHHTDEEAAAIWKRVAIGIPVVKISTSDNFWSMGDVGPCGPCSEIFYDLGQDISGGIPGSPDQDGDRYMEIWNIVFMQFEQTLEVGRTALKKKSIDTGMGLERIAAIMQGVADNYQTDLFKETIDAIKTISGTNFESTYPSYKVIADHIRSISFLIAEGISPSNEGRGYVLRRILRRAMRHGNLINIKEPFLFKLSDFVIGTMKSTYPELERSREMIALSIRLEEERFLTTLDNGLKLLQNSIKEISPGGILNGDEAFKLYDTYGFPLDLTQDILKSENIKVDMTGFEAALLEQKNRSKWTGSGEAKEDYVWHNLKNKFKSIEFLGYAKENVCSEILAIIHDGKEISQASSDLSNMFLVARATPFYAKCGGQCGDSGIIECETGVFEVIDTKRFCGEIIAHEGRIKSGTLKAFGKVELKINFEKRRKIKANHSATHLLQAALLVVFGKHIVQRGSFLDEDRLRFDFSHDSAMSDAEILEIEKIINGWILQNCNVVCETMQKDKAISAGATALFGEKYGDFVRAISIFDSNMERISFELCGGTHVKSTGEIGLFKILSEAGIGSGVRRIEAVTGEKVLEYLQQAESNIRLLSEKLKCSDYEIIKKVETLLTDLKQKDHEILLGRRNMALKEIIEFSNSGVILYSLVVFNYNSNELRSLNDFIRSKKSSGIIVVINQSDDKISFIVSVSPDLQKQYAANRLLKLGLIAINGNGGGNAVFAYGGGSGKEKVSELLESIKNAV